MKNSRRKLKKIVVKILEEYKNNFYEVLEEVKKKKKKEKREKIGRNMRKIWETLDRNFRGILEYIRNIFGKYEKNLRVKGKMRRKLDEIE